MDERALVVCMPPSGAGRSFFRRWPRRLAGARVLPLSRPGHEERMREPLAQSLSAIAHGVAATIGARHPDRVVLFGHSLGATVAFEASRLIEPQCRASALVVSARQAPDLPGRAPDVAFAPDAELLATVRSWHGHTGGTVDGPANELFLPLLRADLELSAGYRWDGGRTTVPVTAISYADDRVVAEDEVRGWARASAGPYRHIPLQGDHFAALAAPESLIGILRDVLAGLAQPATGAIDH